MEITDQWIAGFFDGDGCIKFYKTKTSKSKHGIRYGKDKYSFIISQDKRSIQVLYAIKSRFGCGHVHKSGNNMREFSISDKKHILNRMLPFFLKNPLQTQKLNDFKLLYDDFMKSYPLAKTSGLPMCSENLTLSTQITQDWLIGFIDAEANFHVSMVDDYPRPQFSIGLHLRDLDILKKIKKFLGCGSIHFKKKKTGGFYANYQISSYSDCLALIKMCTTNTNRCLLKTAKRIDFLKFKQVIKIIGKKLHTTDEGIIRIKKILEKKV